ncbi:MAG: hypothetical protein MI976_30845 [Pseudomonadales bacterium]|nr:hypothetical protein [Pseudomonadales bacterium]
MDQALEDCDSSWFFPVDESLLAIAINSDVGRRHLMKSLRDNHGLFAEFCQLPSRGGESATICYEINSGEGLLSRISTSELTIDFRVLLGAFIIAPYLQRQIGRSVAGHCVDTLGLEYYRVVLNFAKQFGEQPEFNVQMYDQLETFCEIFLVGGDIHTEISQIAYYALLHYAETVASLACDRVKLLFPKSFSVEQDNLKFQFGAEHKKLEPWLVHQALFRYQAYLAVTDSQPQRANSHEK